MHSEGEIQSSSVFVGSEALVYVSDTEAKLHIPVAEVVAEGLFAAKADELTSRCHDLVPLVGQSLLVAVEKRDDPIRYRGG